MHASTLPPRRHRFVVALAAIATVCVLAAGIYLGVRKDVASPDASIAQPASAPRTLPDLRFQNGDGKPVMLSDFRGRFVLLNVWATWCAPCRKEMPALDRLQQKLGGHDFQVVALSIDRGGPAAVRPFYEQMDIRALTVYVDPAVEVTSKLKTVGVPTTLLIDREGRELWRKTGPAEWDSAEVVESLRRHIQGETRVRSK